MWDEGRGSVDGVVIVGKGGEEVGLPSGLLNILLDSLIVYLCVGNRTLDLDFWGEWTECLPNKIHIQSRHSNELLLARQDSEETVVSL